MKKSVLIIKLGYCETLVNEKGFVPSLGDVFRHTVLLHHYGKHEVTWLTSKATIPLLKDNPYIHKLMTYSESTPQDLAELEFDEVLCLEKAVSLCSLAKSVKAKKHLGFDWRKNGTHAHPGAENALDIANGRDQFLPIQALLFEMVGSYWKGQDYILGYKPKPTPTFDIGFNFRVGSKWPTKAWPMKNWKKLEKLCTNHGLSVKWQEGEGDIYEYIDWINACRLIVTCDSLGMHLGLALKKKVVSLFGPTPAEGIYMYGRGVIMTADMACPDAPCMEPTCPNGTSCMAKIAPRTVARTIINLANGRH